MTSIDPTIGTPAAEALGGQGDPTGFGQGDGGVEPAAGGRGHGANLVATAGGRYRLPE